MHSDDAFLLDTARADSEARQDFARLLQLGKVEVALSTPVEIVGIVDDAVYRSIREPMQPTMYWALGQVQRLPSGLSLVVRSAAGRPDALSRSVVAVVSAVDPHLTLVLRPLADQVNTALTQERLLAG